MVEVPYSRRKLEGLIYLWRVAVCQSLYHRHSQSGDLQAVVQHQTHPKIELRDISIHTLKYPLIIFYLTVNIAISCNIISITIWTYVFNSSITIINSFPTIFLYSIKNISSARRIFSAVRT